MNKIYKVKYNAQTGEYTAISELGKNAGKAGKILTALLSAIAMPTVLAAGAENNVRSILDIAGKFSVSFESNQEVDSSQGIFVSGTDMRVGDNVDVNFSQAKNSTGILVADGLLHTEKALNITIPNNSTENNTGLSINGNHANVEVVGASNINIGSTNSTGISIVKGVATLGNAQTLDSDTFRAGVAVVDNENAELTLNQGTVTTTGAGSTGVLLTPEDTKKAVYVQAEGTTVKGTGANSNGIWVKQADNTNINFDVTINGKVEETGTAEKTSGNADNSLNGLDQYAVVNLSGTGTLTASNTAELLTDAEQVAILKRDNGNVDADVAAKVVGKILLTGQGTNNLTLSDNADSEVSTMNVIDGGAGGGDSTLTLKSGGYLLNAYTESNAATQALPTGQTVSQLLNWNNIVLDSAGTSANNYVRLNLVGNTTATDKVTIGTNNWLTKQEIQNVTLTSKLVENSGTIDVRDNTYAENNTLTFTGDYNGTAGSRILMSTSWNRVGTGKKGAISKSDVLHILGNASGSTQVIPMAADGTTENKIIGDVNILDADNIAISESEIRTEEFVSFTRVIAATLDSVPVVKVDGSTHSATNFFGRAQVEDGTEVQLTSRTTATGGREFYWTMYGILNSESHTYMVPIMVPIEKVDSPDISETPPATPSETPPVTVTVTPSETPSVTSSEMPPVTSLVTPSVISSETPSVTSSETPLVTSSETPSVTPSEIPPVTSPVTIPIVQPKVPVYTQTPTANLELGYTSMGTLHERRGENQTTAWDSCGCVQKQATDQAWVRLFGKDLELDGKNRFELNQKQFGIQAGWDFRIHYNPKNEARQHTGVYVTYARGNTDYFDRYRAVNGVISDDKFMGKSKTDAYSLGLSHTRYSKHGAYLDLVGQVSFLNNRYNPRNVENTIKQKGSAFAFSAEVGKPYVFNNSSWLIEPQAQLVYQFLHLNRFKDQSYAIRQEDLHGLRGRAGFRLARNTQHGHFTDTFYFTANVLHDFTSGGRTQIGTGEYSEKYNRTWWEVGVGGQLPVSKHGYIYADARYEHSFSGAKREGYRANIGYKHTW